MADHQPKLLDQWGRPIERRQLTEEIAAPTITGVRSPLSGYPGDGLNPMRLASILREADAGDPLRYLELAETIEERDLHYAGVLATRKRSVAQIEVTVDAASDDAADVEKADLVRDWLLRDELADELFDILDAVGKGYSFTEIIWETSEGQWRPSRLEWRDPRWFRPARHDLTTPLMLGESGEELPLPGGKFITAVLRAKSGLPIRSGLARIVSWAWMFKAFSNRDWAIFTQTFGQPIRIGKYGPGATEQDRDTLYRAVANIAGDCAAIIPDGMVIDFIESKSIGASSDLYEKRVDWLDRQVSKAVLGQTTTTDAISGGHAVSQEHRQVQEDIERADARALAAILNRDLIRVWIDLEYGPQKRYPRLRIARPDEEDLAQLSSLLAQLVPLGLRVQASEIRDKFGLSDPEAGAEVLVPPRSPAAAPESAGMPADPRPGDGRPTLHQERHAGGRMADELIADAALALAGPAVGGMVERVRGLVAQAGSLEEAIRALENASAARDAPADLTAAMRQALLLAWLSGEAAEADRSRDGD
jgi:phage gp29-like protein